VFVYIYIPFSPNRRYAILFACSSRRVELINTAGTSKVTVYIVQRTICISVVFNLFNLYIKLSVIPLTHWNAILLKKNGLPISISGLLMRSIVKYEGVTNLGIDQSYLKWLKCDCYNHALCLFLFAICVDMRLYVWLHIVVLRNMRRFSHSDALSHPTTLNVTLTLPGDLIYANNPGCKVTLIDFIYARVILQIHCES
jgi:hypothetical protein